MQSNLARDARAQLAETGYHSASRLAKAIIEWLRTINHDSPSEIRTVQACVEFDAAGGIRRLVGLPAIPAVSRLRARD